MKKQKSGVYDILGSHFSLPVYEDEIAEDEEEQLLNFNTYNFFILEMGDFRPSGKPSTSILQEIMIDYYSENRDDVDEVTIDVISLVSSIKGVKFTGTQKQRLQVKDLDRYIDRVTFLFRRVIPIECTV
ncbi:hypothetical protein A3781_17345 [Bacillus badius]|nr:hypothetical protein A3781_17345 [Bacillus badius]